MIEKCINLFDINICLITNTEYDMFLILVVIPLMFLLLTYFIIGSYFYDRLLNEMVARHSKSSAAKIVLMMMFLWLPLWIKYRRNIKNVQNNDDRRYNR